MTNLGASRLAPVFIDDVAALAADSLADPAAATRSSSSAGRRRCRCGRSSRARSVGRPVAADPARAGAAPQARGSSRSPAAEPPADADAIDFINQPATVDLGPLLERMPRRLTPLEEGLATYLRAPEGVRWIAPGTAELPEPVA